MFNFDKVTGYFLVVTEKNNEVIIEETTSYEYTGRGLNPPFEENDYVPALKSYETMDGKPCNRLSETEFLIFDDIDEVEAKVKSED